jgi:hypothetical protein
MLFVSSEFDGSNEQMPLASADLMAATAETAAASAADGSEKHRTILL